MFATIARAFALRCLLIAAAIGCAAVSTWPTAHANERDSPGLVRPLQDLGTFRVTGMWRVTDGEIIQSEIAPYDYQVLSNGERVEISLKEAETSKRVAFTVYQSGTRIITQNDSSGVATSEGMLASSLDGGTLRQVLLTPDRLRITRMPPNSLDIIVIEARKIATEKSEESK